MTTPAQVLAEEITVTLRLSSWQNNMDTLHASTFPTVGNFWAAVQRIEQQIDEQRLGGGDE